MGAYMSTFSQFIGARLQSQTFNSSGTFTAPASVNNVWISLSGGGGNTNVSLNGAFVCGAGAGAWCSKLPVGVTPGSSYTVTVGGTGGTSSFGNLVSRSGGGSGGNAGNGNATFGGSGGAQGGTYNPNTAAGQATSAGGNAGGQSGGGGFFGDGANGGSGGGGAFYGGQSGYSGKVVVEWLA